jgi:hypothetical protein
VANKGRKGTFRIGIERHAIHTLMARWMGENWDFIGLALIWLGVIFSAITGIISTPRFQARRSDNAKEFWTAFWWFTGISVIATVFGLWARFYQ